MKLYVTRDSVCAGDDADAPHAGTFEAHSVSTVADLVNYLVSHYPLPRISGGRATWLISSCVPLAVVAEQWSEPRMIHFCGPGLDECDLRYGVIGVHLSYLAQVDPEMIHEVMGRLQLKARW